LWCKESAFDCEPEVVGADGCLLRVKGAFRVEGVVA
jgi:hypothetical protein